MMLGLRWEWRAESLPPLLIRGSALPSLLFDCSLTAGLRMKAAAALLILSATLCAAQKPKVKTEWDYRNEERVNTKGCANLTLVLDNWKYAIMTQVKDLLLHDHNTVLPDYGRIQPLSDALGDLYKEFNSMKEHLAELTAKFDGVESFVDSMRSGRKPAPMRGEPRPPGLVLREREAAATDAGGRPPGRRSRVIVRRIKKPVQD
ncbi:uncharacterized protein LOC104936237 isoform X2 [Larimichthys crocea]|nr:uncharacterized protein LOC104936237 isoform X2 [Larimichthys crocea]